MERNDKKYSNHVRLANPSIFFSFFLLVLLVIFGQEESKYFYSFALIFIASPILINGIFVLYYGYSLWKPKDFNIFSRTNKGYIVRGKKAKLIGNLHILLFCIISFYALVELADL